jgi:type IV secretion system protein VirB8
MKKKKQKEVKIKSWYYDRYVMVIMQRNILLFLVIISLLAIAFSMIFVKYVSASKSLEPYVVEIEEKTGIATVVDTISAKKYTDDKITKEYFITQFITAIKKYNPRTYNSDRELVRLLSSSKSDVFSRYKREINPNKLGSNSYLTTKIKSINFTSDNSAQIRTLQEGVKEGEKIKKHEMITIGFKFFPNMNLAYDERMINPFGFQILEYSSIEEKLNY